MVTTLPKPQSEVTQAQEHHQAAKERLSVVLARVDQIRTDASEADGILSKADATVGKAKWAGKDTVKAHQDSESAGRAKWACEAALELAPSKLREGLRALWTAEISLEEAQAQQEEAEALQGREEELAPLEAAWGRERAEAHLEKEYALPEIHGSVRLGDNGSYETVFPVGGVVTVSRPEWFITLHVGLPNRQKRVRGLGKQIQTLGDRTPEDLEKTARKLAAQLEA